MSNAAATPALHVENLKIDRGGRTVIRSISLSVPAGIITGLLGPSGCGKTTLMRTIVGEQKITAGSAKVFGQPAGARSLRRRIGYVTQSPSIYPDLTTVENVRYFARLYGVDKKRAYEVIDSVGLTAKKSELAGNLSGGQQGRVSLACALVCDPDLLILDEPTVGLDPVLRAELWEQFAGLAASGKTLLISSHAMDEARNCTNLILMRDGAVLAHAAPADITRQTACADLESAFMRLVRSDQPSNRPVAHHPINPHRPAATYYPSPNHQPRPSHPPASIYPRNPDRPAQNFPRIPTRPNPHHPTVPRRLIPNDHPSANYSRHTPKAWS